MWISGAAPMSRVSESHCVHTSVDGSALARAFHSQLHPWLVSTFLECLSPLPLPTEDVFSRPGLPLQDAPLVATPGPTACHPPSFCSAQSPPPPPHQPGHTGRPHLPSNLSGPVQNFPPMNFFPRFSLTEISGRRGFLSRGNLKLSILNGTSREAGL